MRFDIAPAVNFGVSGVGNWFLTKKAAADPSLRIPLWKPKDGAEPSVYSDARFVGAVAGVGLATVGENAGGGVGKWLARGGEILAHMTGHSLIATEAIRKVATEGQAAQGVAPGASRGVYRLGADEAAQQAAAYAYGFR